jgi:hypothetical protein
VSRRLLSPDRIRELRASPDDETEAERRLVLKGMESQRGLAMSLRDALQLPPAEDDDDEDIGFELQEPPAVFYIGEKEVRFPVGNDEQSKRARAVAMREFLSREIGGDVLGRVMAELRDHELRYDAESPTCESLDQGYVIIARQLYVVEFDQ